MKPADPHTAGRSPGVPVFVHRGAAYVPQEAVIALQRKHSKQMRDLFAQVREESARVAQLDALLRDFNTQQAPAHGRAAVPGALHPAGVAGYPPVQPRNHGRWPSPD